MLQGYSSHAEGSGTIANGDNSHSSGWFTITNDYCEITGGQYNVIGTGSTTSWIDTDNLFTLGNGTSDVARSNAFQVKKNGKVIAASSVKVGTDSTAASAANVGAIRYRSGSNNSYCEMVMQSSATSYDWVVIYSMTW